jgi:endonuclease/exonuclease/phosphatase family metal-dependent hydrolase
MNICRHFVAILIVVLAVAATAAAQQKRLALYGVAFYNLENLFDTCHDYGKNDFEFLPDGTYKWTGMKYKAKLANMSKVLSELCTNKIKAGATVVGVSEIENRGVLEDLLRQPALKDKGWKVMHFDGPDRRGVECALFYNPRFFQLIDSCLVPYVYPNNDTTHITRGFLVATGKIAGEMVHVIVNHWPSRGAESPVRERAGLQVKAVKDSLLRVFPDSKVIVMGDLNDDPNNKSVTEALGAVHKKKDVKSNADMYNPWWDTLYKVGQGTLLYNGKWNLFDQIIVSGGFIGTDRSSLLLYSNEVFVRDYLLQQDGKYKGAPKRTHASGVWLNGYSDHLPTCIYLIKEL